MLILVTSTEASGEEAVVEVFEQVVSHRGRIAVALRRNGAGSRTSERNQSLSSNLMS
jgi:hypothetical protein